MVCGDGGGDKVEVEDNPVVVLEVLGEGHSASVPVEDEEEEVEEEAEEEEGVEEDELGEQMTCVVGRAGVTGVCLGLGWVYFI